MEQLYQLPTTTLTDVKINEIVNELKITNYLGTLMSDEVAGFKQNHDISAIINLQPHTELGSHWTAIATFNSTAYYFDSYAQSPPPRVVKFLKSKKEYDQGILRIHCNALIVQREGSTNCGALCIFVLFYLTRGIEFNKIINYLYHHLHHSPVTDTLWLKTTQELINGK